MAASSAPVAVYEKDPNATLDYTEDWRLWLGDDILFSSAWVLPAGVVNAGESHSATTATLWISGGVAGSSYSVYNQITTINGRTDKRTIKVNAVDR